MAKVVDKYAQNPGRTLFICDFSPPRGADAQALEAIREAVRHLEVDFLSVAYNPGKSARVSSVIAAHWIKANTGKDVSFTLATRDMNKLALQSLLLGAQVLGLENLVVVKGDDFTERERAAVKDVNDFRPTELLRSISEMNLGTDFKGLKLASPTSFCAGATLDLTRGDLTRGDLTRGMEGEVGLTRRKVEAGAQFFLSQPTFDPGLPRAFLNRYAERCGEELQTPVFHGVQVMSKDSIQFGIVPQWVTDDLSRGRSGLDIALQELHGLAKEGLRSIYLVPPILRGGRRDYEAAQAVLDAFGEALGE